MGDPEAVIAILEPAGAGPVNGTKVPRTGRASGRPTETAGPYHSWSSPKVFTSAASASLLLLGSLIRLAGGRPEWSKRVPLRPSCREPSISAAGRSWTYSFIGPSASTS